MRRIGAKVVAGPAANSLQRRVEAEQADLLAIGRHARSGLVRILSGATAEDLALHATSDAITGPAP